jgi:DUF917 family protein
VRLTPDNLPDFEAGLALLGSGGGGGTKPLSWALGPELRRRPVDIVPFDSLAPDQGVALVGIVGGTSVLPEKPPSGHEHEAAQAALTRHGLGQPDAIMALECAGQNGICAALAAAKTGLPLVDADLMGRAMPSVDQLSSSGRVDLGPIAFATPTGEVALVEPCAPDRLEAILRAAVVAWGGWVLVLTGPVPVRQLRRAALTGTPTRALTLGRALLAAPPGTPTETIASLIGGRLIAEGRIAEVVRDLQGQRFGRGHLTIQDPARGLARVAFENEFLLASLDGRVVATAPDLLVLLAPSDRDLLRPERLRPGPHVAVIAAPGPAWWRATPERLRRVAPRAFGIDHDPVLGPALTGPALTGPARPAAPGRAPDGGEAR